MADPLVEQIFRQLELAITELIRKEEEQEAEALALYTTAMDQAVELLHQPHLDLKPDQERDKQIKDSDAKADDAQGYRRRADLVAERITGKREALHVVTKTLRDFQASGD